MARPPGAGAPPSVVHGRFQGKMPGAAATSGGCVVLEKLKKTGGGGPEGAKVPLAWAASSVSKALTSASDETRNPADGGGAHGHPRL